MSSEYLWPEGKIEATSSGPHVKCGISGAENQGLVTSMRVLFARLFVLLLLYLSLETSSKIHKSSRAYALALRCPLQL